MSNCSSLRNGHRARCYSFRPTNTNNVQTDQPSSSASVGSQHSQEGIKMSLTAVRAHRLGKQLGDQSLQPPTTTGTPATQAGQQTGKRSSQPDQPNQPCQCNQGWLAAQKINNGRKNIIKLLILILVMYFLCWGTWLTAKLIMWWAGNTSLPYSPAFYRFSVIAKHLPAIHATINPIIYSIMSGNFRKQLCICRTEEP
ncbi:uncharacterized protein LOC111696275 [Eurytemora carolleeae]|uniref:uncharacterized protein LOC111696275 n=1 Tax=Eurytemora carolleeae TaxID=1294199 RepID=UPI000C76AD73|nr:uncharacterized protein LOC111696275 [Eurytemora carolleeae]|eukprot:XP_023321600.1 uncharacterized protein LOC111696275 [Eurytemora affinis]